MADAEAEELISWAASDADEKVGEPTCSDEELYAVSLYFWFLAHISCSVGALPLEGVSDANNAEAKGQDGEEENDDNDRVADNSTDHLSVMYPPCQDPLLFKIYQDLPALPYVALFILNLHF